MAYKLNAFGRSYHNGIALSDDMRTWVIDEIIKEGGNRTTGYIPVTYKEIAKRINISVSIKL